MNKLKIILPVSFFYIAIFLFSIFIMSTYESSYSQEVGAFYSFGSFTFIESIAFFLYKFVLPLPLGLPLLFSDKLLYLNVILLIPNIALVSFLILKFKKGGQVSECQSINMSKEGRISE